MFDFEVSSNNAVLALDIEELQFGFVYDPICFHNSPTSPTETIYLILPTKSPKEKVLNWRSTTSLTGPAADLIILARSDVSFKDIDFKDFRSIMVSDNKFYHDANRMLTINYNEYGNHAITLENCKANNAYFLCNNLRWFGGAVKENLYVELHGNAPELQIEGTDKDRTEIGSLIIPKGTKKESISIIKSSIRDNFTCEEVDTLSIRDLKTGGGKCRLIATDIKELSNFQTLSDELIIKASFAKISSFIARRAKVRIEVDCIMEFIADNFAQLQGIELHIDVSKANDKNLDIPYGKIEFDKIFIKGAREVNFLGDLIVREAHIEKCSQVSVKHVNAGRFTYETEEGTITFRDGNDRTIIGNLWLIGSIRADFWGAAKVRSLETDIGRCQINIYNNFIAEFINLNLNLDRKKEIFDSENQGYFGIHIQNKGKHEVIIGVLLAKLTELNISGRVKLGMVVCLPLDSQYNLIQIDPKYFNETTIEGFFVGYGYEIAIDKNTGKISLVQSTDRMITNGGKVVADMYGSINEYMIIRAGMGLSFHGKLKVIGEVELSTLYGKLSVSGRLESSKRITMAAGGELDVNGTTLIAPIVDTYAGAKSYIGNAKIDALQFLSTAVGKYSILNTNIKATNTAIKSENSELLLQASNINAAILEALAKESVRIEKSKINTTKQNLSGEHVYVEESNLQGKDIQLTADQDIGFASSNVTANNLTNQAGRDIRMIFTRAGTTYLVNTAKGDISIRATEIKAGGLSNNAGGSIEIASGSGVETEITKNKSGGKTKIADSTVSGELILFESGKGINIENSNILGDHSIFLHAVENFLSVNSNITLGQYPYKLFLHKGGIDQQGNPLVKCGLSLPSTEVLGIMGQKGSNQNLSDCQFSLVNSSETDLGIFSYLANDNKKAIIIDAATGVIIGSNLSAKNHQVIIKTKHGIELLPLNLYNTVMFSGGFNLESVTKVITKIEAGFIELDGGSIIHLVSSLLKASEGSLKADYIIDEPTAKNRSLQELSMWLGSSQGVYDMIVDSSYVPTRLEFSEVTKIDLGKGKVNIFYPYSSKEVYLRQREGDVLIGKDVKFLNEVMALHVDQGKIFFGIPKTESFLFKFFGKSYLVENHTTEPVEVEGKILGFSAGKGIELHGGIKATGTLTMKTGGDVKISGGLKNFGTEVKPSVIRANNVYITADNIEVAGSVITARNYLKLVSNNDIIIMPIPIFTRYAELCGKSCTKKESIEQIVSEINAGIINIDAGRAVEFIGSLISAEGLIIHAKDLKISAAKEIFTKQVEFQGKKKWHGGGRNSSTVYTYAETVVPTEMHVGTLKVVVDHNATIEASQIFVRDQVLTEIKGNLTIKDGYNLHIHDHHVKKYSVLSFGNGSVKLHSSKSIQDITKQTEGIPTLVCAGGIFYGIVDGRMHVLGSTIIGKDIHLVVPNGLKLEASRHTDESITFVNEKGAKLGYYHKGNQEFGVRAGASASTEVQKIWHQHLSKTVIAAQDTLSILVRDGTFEQISSDLAAKIIHVEARNWVAKTYDEKVIVDYIKQYVEFGGKIAVKQTVTSSVDKARMLINKKGNHVIDNADRVFKAYDTYKSFAALPTNAFTGGSYAYLEASQAQELANTSIAIDNIISSDTIIAKVKEDIRFEGVQMQARDVDIEAENFIFETSKDKKEVERSYGQVDIDIGISNPSLTTGGASGNSSKSSAEIHHQNYIRASGYLKITLTADGEFKGVSLEGANVDIKAKNLILESVQDVIAKKISGANFNIGLDQGYGIKGFGGYGEKGTEKSGWTNQIARIIGTQVVNVVVKETLELAGGLIANGEEDKNGNLTDKGNLSVNCGRLIVKTIHDYDNGLTLGIGTSFQEGQDKNGKNEISFHHAPLKVQFKDHKRTVAGTIGQGAINAGGIIGDPLNRDLAGQTQETKKVSAGFDAPIHADMLKTLAGWSQDGSKEQNAPLPKFLANYFVAVADTFKGALRDSIIAGAEGINSVGGRVDTEALDQKVQQLLDWRCGTKSSPAEVEKIKEVGNGSLAEILHYISIEDNLDLSDEEQYKAAVNKAKYYLFFSNLGYELQNSDNTAQANALSAALKIYQTYYLQELQNVKEEGRPLKEFGSFISELNGNRIYKDTTSDFVEKIHSSISRSLAGVELTTASSPDKDGTIHNVMLHAFAAAAKAVEKEKAASTNKVTNIEPEQSRNSKIGSEKIRPINDPAENQSDTKLKGVIKQFVQDNPKYAKEIEKIGYKELKRQLVEAAGQSQDKPKDRSLLNIISNGINQLFGIPEAHANPLAIPVIIQEIIVYGGPLLIGALAADKVVKDGKSGDDQAGSISAKRKQESSVKPQVSKPTASAISGMPNPDDFEPDDDQVRKEQYKLDQKAKKFGFSDGKSANTRQILDNLDTTVESFISKYRKGSIYSEFPREYLHDKAGNPITIRDALKDGGRTVRKLLIDNRFSK